MPSFDRIVHAVDSHTGGEPTRVVMSGLPRLEGATMLDRYQEIAEKGDGLRRFLMWEPRGHRDMFGALLFPAVTAEADYGVIFCDNRGFLTMCGHGSIGVAKTLVATGAVATTHPTTTVRLDTPVGLVELTVETPEGGPVGPVRLRNVPAVVIAMDRSLTLSTRAKTIAYDVVFGGLLFALVDAGQFDLEIEAANASELTRIGMELLRDINASATYEHPANPKIRKVSHIELFRKGDPTRNAVVFGNGQLDRSPCGTGTSSKVALLAARGELAPGELFVHQSITGSQFVASYEEGPEIAGRPSVIPHIRGRAFLTAMTDFVAEADDPQKEGFFLG
ncbi:proline racemase family protein [Aminithiophilus ramosus]|uniref:Proline racemase family protein n=2 Tax=Synergistales TaxID=649776 RepID=A0A9Q7EZU9_9BACT|nr:proline racemase family protein [Aminithiophilus ramosus]QTX32562.1 proline racemase family protein [Aminithiophilus ramosus]QVL36443.1 proline racemase family protein [Synergistota bacterium]